MAKKKITAKKTPPATNVLQVKHVTLLFAYLFIAWGFYRMLFQFPEPFDELLVKPIVWLVPLFVLLRKEKLGLSSIGVTMKNLFPSIYLALILGSLFAFEGLLINYLKYKGMDFAANIGQMQLFTALFVSFITAVSEELTFRGYIYTRLSAIVKSEWSAVLITTFAWTAIHIPIALLDWRLSLSSFVTYLFLVFIFGFGASFLYSRTQNILAPILLHLLWAWPIILFR